MRKSMLTYRTLDRFEELVDIDTLTDEQIKKVEFNAYCANMGREDDASAWFWFVHLVNDVDRMGLNLEA